MLLRVLLYGMADAEVKYACSEMLDHLGLPYGEINDLCELGDASHVSDVLILPETSRIGKAEVKAVRESSCSVLFSGHNAEDLWTYLCCRSLRLDGCGPPKISGLFHVKEMGRVPVFYDFAVLAGVGERCEKVAGIETEHGNCVGAVVGERDSRCVGLIVPQLFRSAAYLLAGSEATLPVEMQQNSGLLDAHGRVDGRKTEVYKQGFLRVPIVNFYERFLLEILMGFSKKMKTSLVYKWFYPGDYDMALCLTHDVECIANAASSLNVISSLKAGKVEEAIAEGVLGFAAALSSLLCRLGLLERRDLLKLLPIGLVSRLLKFYSLWNFERYVNVESIFDGTSSFYFLMNRTKLDSDYDFESSLLKDVTKWLREKGWDVGLHASYYSHDDSKELADEKSRLEKALGGNIFGVKQHFLKMNIPITWRLQAKGGFSYDTTFGYPQVLGFRAGSCFPFAPWDSEENKQLSILEIPLIVTDDTLLQKRYSASPPEIALEACQKLVDTTHDFNGVLTLHWHSSLDRKRLGVWLELYKKILDYSLKYRPWYVNGRELSDWWRNRREVKLCRMESSKHQMKMSVTSPSSIRNFMLKIRPPHQERIERILVNGFSASILSASKEETYLSVCLSLKQGQNILLCEFS